MLLNGRKVAALVDCKRLLDALQIDLEKLLQTVKAKETNLNPCC